MKILLLLIIKFYWRYIPASKRRRCIFEESCSNYVYRITKEKGFWHGIKTFQTRYHQCRPGYKLGYNSITGLTEMHLKNGTVISEQNISGVLKN